MLGWRSLDVRVLGPLRASVDGAPVVIPGRAQVVLAALALAGGRRVSDDELIGYCWGDQLPQRPRAALHTVIARVRALVGAELIKTVAAGYALDTERSVVDLQVFRDLLRRSEEDGPGEHIRELLCRALDLWQGEPLAGVPSKQLRAATSAGLTEEWTAAVLRRIDLDLQRGRLGELIGELRKLTAAHPLREEFWYRLMTALQRDGRRTDALSAYHEARTCLRDQLGVDPGPDLQRLHLRLLRADGAVRGAEPTLDARPVAEPGPGLLAEAEPGDHQPTAGGPAAVPLQLPADTVHFAGRGDQLSRLLDLCPTDADVPGAAAPGTVVISAVEGMAGVGKTALAVHAAHQLASRFADGVLFVDLRGFTPGADPVSPEHALDYLLRGLGVHGTQIPPDLDGRAALYRTVLARRRALIVLDNAVDEAQLQPLLAPAPHCWLLVTSRRHLAGLDDAVHLSLPVLPPAEAAALFRTLVDNQAAPAAAPIVDEIVSQCGNLPLAIRIAAARLKSSPAGTPERLLAELSEALGSRQDLDWLSDGHRAVAAALDVSYRQLTGDQQYAFRLLGLHPGADVEPYALAALAETTVGHAQRLLEQLHAANLLDEPTYHRYTLHDLVATYIRARSLHDPEPDRHAALARLLRHYAHTTSVATELSYPFELTYPWEAGQRPHTSSETPTPPLDETLAPQWIDTELDNLLATAQHAPHIGQAEHTVHLARMLHRHLRVRGRYSDSHALHTMALEHARACGNRVDEHNALLGLGHVHLWQGRHDEAADSYQQSLTIAHEIGDRTGEQIALHGLGDVHSMQNRFDPATDHLERALTIALETGHLVSEQDTLNCLGRLHQSMARYEQAMACYQRALSINREIRHLGGEQGALQGIGDIQWLQGRHELAVDTYRQVIGMARTTGNPIREQCALCGLGNVHRSRGEYEQACEHYQRALAIAQRTGDRDCQLKAHQGLGRAHHAAGHHQDALAHHHTALNLATDLGQPADQASAHDGLASTYRALGDTTHSHRHRHTALQILTNRNLERTNEPDVTTTTIQAHLDASCRES